jgi:predicted transposase/invertase (TIGR01784 family)
MGNKQKVVRISPLNAVVFACIFQDAEKSGEAMLDFLNAVLKQVGEEPIKEIIDMRSEYSVFGASADQKYGRLDVRVKAESGRLFDIEVQIARDYMNERGFFYGGRMGEDEFKPGASYDQMPEVRVINLVDFYVRDDQSHVVEPVVLSYANSPGEVATNKFKMYHIQLPAFRKNHKTLETVKDDVFLSWLYMLDRGYKYQDEMEVLSGMTEGLKNFAAQYNYAINDPELIRRYRMIEDGKHDIATRISVAEKRGAEQKNLENAKGLKQEGVDPAIISRVTGLSLDEIAKL